MARSIWTADSTPAASSPGRPGSCRYGSRWRYRTHRTRRRSSASEIVSADGHRSGRQCPLPEKSISASSVFLARNDTGCRSAACRRGALVHRRWACSPSPPENRRRTGRAGPPPMMATRLPVVVHHRRLVVVEVAVLNGKTLEGAEYSWGRRPCRGGRCLARMSQHSRRRAEADCSCG